MSFAAPLVLLALLAIPVFLVVYALEQRRRANTAGAFVNAPLMRSIAPQDPGRRRHVPTAILALAAAVLVLSAAKPQHPVSVPVSGSAVMLVNDTSSSMASKDVNPSRLVAAENAARRFALAVPGTVHLGLIKFTEQPTLLQSPSPNHQLTIDALSGLRAYGHTAIGRAIQRADQILEAQKTPLGKRIPAAIVLISDGGSDLGVSPITAAKQSKAAHIPIYTVALGTAHGTISVPHKGATGKSVPVPLAPATLDQIGQASGGHAYTVNTAGSLSAVYQHLAAQLGHKTVQKEITQIFAGVGLALLLLGGALSLIWFGRLA